MLARLKEDILCKGVPVVKATPYLDVNQSTIPALSPYMTILSQSYSVSGLHDAQSKSFTLLKGIQ